jgi:hypothetical protein
MILGSGIRNPGSGIRNKPIPDPGSRGQKGTGSRIPEPDPQHWKAERSFDLVFVFDTEAKLTCLFLLILHLRKIEAKQILFIPQIRKIKAERTLFIPQIGKSEVCLFHKFEKAKRSEFCLFHKLERSKRAKSIYSTNSKD